MQDKKSQLLIMDSVTGGVYDLSDVAGGVQIHSAWNNGASTLKCSYPRQGGRRFANGSTVTFRYAGTPIFYGYLQKTQGEKNAFSIFAADQLRYFKPSNTILRKEMPLSDWINTVALQVSDDDRIRLGNIQGTGANLPKKLFDGKTHLDMIYSSIEENLGLTGEWYTLYDNFGALDLVNTLDLRLPLIIGDESLCTDYNYTVSIDDDNVANFVKLAKDDKEAGVRNIYVAKDSANIQKWGKIMHYEKVTTDRNDAQIQELAEMLLVLKNREAKTLRLEALGDPRVKGGSGIKVELADERLSGWMIVNSVTHKFTSSQHTMNMEMRWGEWT